MTEQERALEYLQKYGYLGAGRELMERPEDTEDLLSVEPGDNVFRSVLADFQAMANLTPTGELDEATLAAMDRDRCGTKDVNGTLANQVGEFVAFGTRWDHAIITYRFENATPDLTQDIQRNVIRTAFSRWAAIVPLVFRKTTGAPDIAIRFAAGDHGDGNAFDGTNGTLAHAYYPPPNAGALAGDVHYDEDERWQQGTAAGGFDLLTVSVHEIGHSLGLQHTGVPSSTMNPFYPTPSTPAQDDRDGVRQVYTEHIWVASLYRDLLNRRFDDGGLDFWVRERLVRAVTPQGIARGFCYSQEFSNTLATELYHWLLDRAPDSGGLAGWTRALVNGMSRQTAIVGFLSSQEYLSRNAVPNAFVQSLYVRLLNRQPDPGGFNFWVERMRQGMSPTEVARGFVNSEEFCRNYAAGLYRRFLRRAPDAGGWQSWTNALVSGLAHQDAMIGFLTSAEYRNAVRGWW